MISCDSTHDEIVYTGRKCPLCIAVDEIDRLKETVRDLEDTRDMLQRQIDQIIKDAEKEIAS